MAQSKQNPRNGQSNKRSVNISETAEPSQLTVSERLLNSLQFLDDRTNYAADLTLEEEDDGPPTRTEICAPVGTREPVEYQFVYRNPLELLQLVNLAPVQSRHTIACTPILSGVISIGADLRYNQTWRFRELRVGDISSSMALAPGETVTLNIKKTQRIQLNQTTVESSESLDSFESSLVDKDVLNVTRSTTRTQQWHVDGNASLSLGGVFQIGSSGGVSGSVQSTSNRSVEQITEATQKSARRLQTLQKIEVGRQTESLLETSQTRTITNPYRDRALTLNFFELCKSFYVRTALSEIQPLLVLQITDLDMGWDFVVSNGDFLDNVLLDRTLASELRSALETVRRPRGPSQLAQARLYAGLAFELLFERLNIFNVTSLTMAGGASIDPNTPNYSFDASLTNNGLDTSIDNNLARTFATLNFYYHLYTTLNQQQRDEMEIDLAVALAESIKTEWEAATADDVESVMNQSTVTEVMRRIPGFLSVVDNLLTPLIKPLEAEVEAKQAAERAEFVIGRVTGHLNCFKSYYIQRFLRYLNEQAGGYPLADTLRAALPQVMLPGGLNYFDFNAGFLDGFQFVVPGRYRLDLNDGIAFIEQAAGLGQQAELGTWTVSGVTLTIPTDGVHIEPATGCILRELPDVASSVNAAIRINADNIPNE